MPDSNINKDELIDEILSSQKKENTSIDKFVELEKVVKTYLEKQDSQKALETITIGALKLGSSDIHFDNSENDICARFRIDGVLVDIMYLSKKEYKILLERIKHSSSLKLNISNIPQDGKYSLSIGENNIDVRVSTLPTNYGENVVSRVLDSKKAIVDFESLGFYWTSKRVLEKSIKKKNGMILITGPTGSGKTTTLYTLLSKLNTRDKKLVTLEDPIEYKLDGVIQSEVNEKNNYTYEMGLKALLRQDPDVIMLGEIREYQTLSIAVNASLTGHLVLSTLHTKSAGETIDRIINMGLKPYLLASALDTIIAQRLVRRICPHCKTEKAKSPNEELIIQSMLEEVGMSNLTQDGIKLYEGKGCSECNNTGFKGRIGVYEILEFNTQLKTMIREGESVEEIIDQARKNDMITMQQDGILKALKGYTTIEEVLRVL